jgi:hypothetical protein
MDDVLKKRISIVVSICCLSLAIGITVKTNFGGGYGGGSTGPIQMLCVNPKCGQAFELSEKEFGNLTSQEQSSDMTATGTPVFKCTKCNEKTAYARQLRQMPEMRFQQISAGTEITCFYGN